MAYKVLGNTAELFKGHGPREGLEGPFLTPKSKTVVYYDPQEGAYWDPETDLYISTSEFGREASAAMGRGWM